MKSSPWFVIVTAVFITSLLVANIISVKLINLFSLVVPAGVIIFPLSYIFGDILTEVYGYRQARKVIWLGFSCNLIAITAIWLAQIAPPASIWEGQEAYETILGFATRLFIASFIAYLFGEFANSFVLAKMKIVTSGRWLWTRTISSTLVGQGLDSLIFITLAFVGTVPTSALPMMIGAQTLVKTSYEVIATPLTYMIVTFLKKREGIDTYDYDTDFNPILIAD